MPRRQAVSRKMKSKKLQGLPLTAALVFTSSSPSSPSRSFVVASSSPAAESISERHGSSSSRDNVIGLYSTDHDQIVYDESHLPSLRKGRPSLRRSRPTTASVSSTSTLSSSSQPISSDYSATQGLNKEMSSKKFGTIDDGEASSSSPSLLSMSPLSSTSLSLSSSDWHRILMDGNESDRILHRGGEEDYDKAPPERNVDAESVGTGAGNDLSPPTDLLKTGGSSNTGTTTITQSQNHHPGGAGNVRIGKTTHHGAPLSSSYSKQMDTTVDTDLDDSSAGGGGGVDNSTQAGNDFDLESNTQIALLRHEDPPEERAVEGDSIFPKQNQPQQSTTTTATTRSSVSQKDNIFVTTYGDDGERR